MNRNLRIFTIIAGSILGLLLTAGLILYVITGIHMSSRYTVVPEKIEIPTGPKAIARGKHLAWAISKCVDCHGEDLGGSIYSEGPALGRLAAANLTRGRGGVALDYTDDGWVRAIRHGIDSQGTALLFMPSQDHYFLSDEDLGALIAYLKSLPRVDRVLPRTRAGLSSRWLYLTGRLNLIPAAEIDHEGLRPEIPEARVTKEYGKYLIDVGGCRKCHGQNLGGGPVPFAPPKTIKSSNLSPGGNIDHWELEDFTRALRTGREPDGGNIEQFMPWKYTAGLTDNEIKAMWLYLQSL